MVRKKHLISISFLGICLCLANSAAANEFVDNKDGTVTDKTIGITWQAKDDNVQRDWKEAQQYCRNLIYAGHDDWRLPNFYELNNIGQKSDTFPAINLNMFPQTKAAEYWSSTYLPYYDKMAYFVNFGKIDTSKTKGQRLQDMKMKNKYYARCIRGERKKISKPGKQNLQKSKSGK